MSTTPTPESPPPPLAPDADARRPAADFLRYELRADGWSPGRQAAFLAHLADHGVVADAARAVGMSLAGAYALRRTARGYAFSLGWEAALIIARRIVVDKLMAAAIEGEQARWVREEGVTTYHRQNTRLSLALLERINPAVSMPEVMAVATSFDWFVELIDRGASGAALWTAFFDGALPHSEIEARDRVRGALQLCEESALFDDADAGDAQAAPMEYKSLDAAAAAAARHRAMRPGPALFAQHQLPVAPLAAAFEAHVQPVERGKLVTQRCNARGIERLAVHRQQHIADAQLVPGEQRGVALRGDDKACVGDAGGARGERQALGKAPPGLAAAARGARRCAGCGRRRAGGGQQDPPLAARRPVIRADPEAQRECGAQRQRRKRDQSGMATHAGGPAIVARCHYKLPTGHGPRIAAVKPGEKKLTNSVLPSGSKQAPASSSPR